MNTRPVLQQREIATSLAVAFNEDSTCFAIGLDTGFGVFNVDPCELRVARDLNGGIGRVAMLGKTNYLALVGGGRRPKFPQNKVIIWDDHKKSIAMTLEFRSLVYKAQLSRSRIIVALHNSIHIYAFGSPSQKLFAFETADNPHGLCCLGHDVVAFPGKTPGQVQIVELSTGNVSIIPAHNHPLRALSMSHDGTTLATASETGTLIKIFALANCAQISELRRGVDPADIYSMAFSPNDALLAVSSDKATLHIFEVAPAPSEIGSSPRGSTGAEQAERPIHLHGSSPDHHSKTSKWGILGRLPMLPRVFSDTYSVATARFAIDDRPEAQVRGYNTLPVLGIPGGKAMKGIIGWTSDDTLVVVGAGRDGQWEKMHLGEKIEGKRVLTRVGWKRYLSGS